MKNRSLIIGAAVVAAIAIGGIWFWQSQDESGSTDPILEATGVIEARTVTLSPEVGGQVVEILAEEGQSVAAGETLVKLDDAVIQTRVAQAEAVLSAAEANFSLLRVGARAEELEGAEAQLAQAESSLRMAQASLAGWTGAARPEDLASTRDQLDKARENYQEMSVMLTSDQVEMARSALNSAQDNLEAARAHYEEHLAADARNPDYILDAASTAVVDAQTVVDAARAAYEVVNGEAQPYIRQLELARLSWQVALANQAQAEARRTGIVRDSRATSDAKDAAEDLLADARDQEAAAREAYEELGTGLGGLQLEAAWDEVQRVQDELDAFGAVGLFGSGFSVESLLAQVEAASASRDAAHANLLSLRNGAREEELDAARAQVDAAQANLDTLQIQLEKHAVATPWDGIVLTRTVEPGETVLPGAALLEIGRLDLLELTVFLPETRFGLLTPGQQVDVRVDTYPGRVFRGTVLRVADEAEFTPTNVQTKEDRVRLVYEVVIGLDNPDLALKPGMIADVEFWE